MYFTIEREWKTILFNSIMAPRPRKYKHPAQISLRIDLTLLEEIDRRREHAGLTRSDFINAVLKEHIKQHPKGSSDLRYPFPDAPQ